MVWLQPFNRRHEKADVRINRKMLAQMAVVDPATFTNVVNATQG